MSLSWSSYGCPCGCGSIAPLYLDPGQRAKWQFSALGEINPYSTKQSTTRYSLSGAAYIHGPLSSSIHLPIVHNQNVKQNDVTLGDPSLSLRWNLVEGNHTFWSPQVQVSGSVKAPLAKSMGDLEKENKWKAAGNGYFELTPQVDLWFHQGKYSAGFSQGFVYSVDKPERKNIRGNVYLSQASLGYSLFGAGQLVGLFEREEKEVDIDRQTKERVGDSKVKYSSGLTGNLRVGNRKTLAVSWITPLEFLSSLSVAKERKLIFSFIQSV